MGDLRRAVMPRSLSCILSIASFAAIFAAIAVTADAAPKYRSFEKPGALGDRVNANIVAIAAGNPEGTYLSIAHDLSIVLDDGDGLRILPVVGKEGGQNIRDVRYMRGVDVGITQSNLLNLYQRSKEIGALDDKIVYIARLFNEEMHLIVRADSNIASIEQLDGKTVNFSDVGSGTQLTARDVFRRIGVKPAEVNMTQADAFEAMKSGEIDATILVAGKPTGSTARLHVDEGFRVLPVPYAKSLQNDYLPATLTSHDYPNLIDANQTVDTIAVGAVLIAYNWERDSDRYRRIAKFVDAFFSRMSDLRKPPRHPKWMETNITATLPGWKRFPAAEEWLQRNSMAQAHPAVRRNANEVPTRAAPEAGLTGSRDQLFQQFLEWEQRRERR